MKHATLLAAVAIVLVANLFGLVHAWRNRSGPLEADITLTERELPLAYRSNDEDSGVGLDLRWSDPGRVLFPRGDFASWLDQEKLQELGFDTGVAPSADKAAEFYQRQRARRAFVALEYDGPTWREHFENVRPSESRLTAVDASTDAARLRARHPDRSMVIIVPAVLRIAVWPSRPASVRGSVELASSSIHVPRPFSDGFRRLREDRRAAIYRVHLRYGASLEPWIVGVEFPASLPTQMRQ